MRKRRDSVRGAIASIHGVLACALALVSLVSQSARAESNDARNFEGNWRGAMDMGALTNSMPTLPYTAEARRIVEKRLELSRQQKPAVGTHLGCRPPTGAEMLSPSVNALVLQTPAKLTMLSQEEREVWNIYIDQPHPKKLQSSYMGESVARWDGDTLVVDTVGHNGKGWADSQGSPLSGRMHMVTRIAKSSDGNTLTLTATFTDPVYYTAPFTKTFKWQRVDDARLVDYDCAENPRSEDFESWTFEDDWFKPVCIRAVVNGLASDKVICERRSKGKR
jgi:hypothetical protein